MSYEARLFDVVTFKPKAGKSSLRRLRCTKQRSLNFSILQTQCPPGLTIAVTSAQEWRGSMLDLIYTTRI